jgi:GH15 family glucan-1,4-alpha-glucosidase
MLAHNPEIQRLLQPEYSSRELSNIRALLDGHGTLSFPSLATGLFPAARADSSPAHTGYHAVWVRDNVHIAHSLMVCGEPARAARTVEALAEHFQRETGRMDAIIADPALAANPSNRPHVKFRGDPIGEIPAWSHDQNDALGYFVWIFCRMICAGHITLQKKQAALLQSFLEYFQAIRFWSDEDSGHWEEARKNSASSVGTVCAGLREIEAMLQSSQRADFRSSIDSSLLARLLERGLQRLFEILPSECVQPPPQWRPYDSALLFLLYPLEIVEEPMGERIVQNVQQHLEADWGIKRYLGDSFWCADYRKRFSAEERTRDFSSDMNSRDSVFEPGTEAQWCIFDPALSAEFGRRYLKTREGRFAAEQARYFNRALCQITPDFQCPELWHWETAADGRRVLETSEATPLAWTQANLLLALWHMEQTAAV